MGTKHDSAIMMESGSKADLRELQPFNASAEKYMKYPDSRKIGEIGKL